VFQTRSSFGLDKYEEASKMLSVKNCKPQNTGRDSVDALDHSAYTGFPTRDSAFAAKAVSSPECPYAGNPSMLPLDQSRGQTIYGPLQLRKRRRVSHAYQIPFAEDDTWTVNRIIYKADERMRQYYKSKAHPDGRKTPQEKSHCPNQRLMPDS
jgi:hypothetical protein